MDDNMVEMINKTFGNKMFVHDDRVDEYLAAGHKLAAKAVDTDKPKDRLISETKKAKK